MPYSRPTLATLKTQVAQDIAASLAGADALLRFANLTILGKIQAGLAYLHYGYLDWVSRMAVPWTSEGEYMLGWGGLKGVTLKAATSASGVATFTGAVGLTIPLGTPLVRGDGVVFNTTALATIPGGGSVAVPATAVVPGAAGNSALAVVLTLGVAIPGINSGGTVTTAFVGGADQETMDAYRTRMLKAYQNPPQGGALADYLNWALAVPGVTRAWPKALGMGPGTVLVYIMLDVTRAPTGFPVGTNGVATADPRAAAATGDQLLVANYIFGDINTPRQPVTALVYVASPISQTVNFTINHIATATADTKAAITAAIKGVFLEFGNPGGLIYLSDIEAAIAAIGPATEGFVITIPTDNISLGAGCLPVLGTVTYT